MHKCKFYIKLKSSERVDENKMPLEYAELVDGWEDGEYYYYKPALVWHSVDPDTGLYIVSGNTRKECQAKTQAKQDAINKVRQSESYSRLKLSFERLVDEAKTIKLRSLNRSIDKNTY